MSEPGPVGGQAGGTKVPPEGSDDAFAAAPASRRMEIAIAAAALALSILALVLSRSIHLRMGAGGLDPKWWPTVLSITAGTLSAALLAYALFGPLPAREEVERAHGHGWARMTSALALTCLYVFFWSRIGFVAPTLLYLFALLWVFELRRWRPLLLYPAITTGFIYVLFHTALRVPL